MKALFNPKMYCSKCKWCMWVDNDLETICCSNKQCEECDAQYRTPSIALERVGVSNDDIGIRDARKNAHTKQLAIMANNYLFNPNFESE